MTDKKGAFMRNDTKESLLELPSILGEEDD